MAIVEFEYIKGRGPNNVRKKKPILHRMATMREGSQCVHDHSGYKTCFSTWLSQQKYRMGRKFAWEKISEDKPIYMITYVEPFTKPDAARPDRLE